MEARELRIGNLVSTPYAEVYECDSFAINHVAYGKLSVNPILLTEEWLLKFGFEKENKTIHEVYKIDFGSYYFNIILTNDNLSYHVRLANCPLKEGTNVVGLGLLRYVHQLQNLYFTLTGKELTIKQS